ncbi:hypothetical protein MUO66_07875, partial [Candidatus Bathyarchaeota archaeon]|nr:hypothetical protein [Candidatus Bathyarchaeota archaeon]
LGLYITKNFNNKNYKGNTIRMAVVDLAESKGYPLNFVCVLPRHVVLKGNLQSKFSDKFGDNSRDMAKELLTRALSIEGDVDMKKEIMDRLKLLDPKPKNMVKCNECGKDFQSRTYRYGKQKTCYDCKAKRYVEKS